MFIEIVAQLALWGTIPLGDDNFNFFSTSLVVALFLMMTSYESLFTLDVL